MIKVLLLGAGGLLGSYLKKNLGTNIDLVCHGRNELIKGDLRNIEICSDVLFSNKYEVIINTICLSDVDKCENDIQLSYELNCKVVENIVEVNKKIGAFIIHISTDHVYDNIGYNKEEDIKLCNIYALTKLSGEIAVGRSKGVVLRTNFFGKSYGLRESFSGWILNSLNNKSQKYFFDVIFNPLHMSTLLEIVEWFIFNRLAGVYNCGSRNALSKFDFAKYLAEIKGFNLVENQSSSIDNSGLIKRPKLMAMNVHRIEEAMNKKMPNLKSEIEKLVNE
jgi:dTDP-4-dehydrorhamnose reductase